MAEEKDISAILSARGFDSIEKVLEVLDSTKADLTKHKTRATDLEATQNRLRELEEEKQKREDAEKTESERWQGEANKWKSVAEQEQAKAVSAMRQAMLERGLGEHMGSVPEKLRPVAGKYLRTVLPTMDWNDPDTLKAAIAAQLADLTADAPPELKPAVPGGGQVQKGGQVQQPPAENPNSLRNLLGKK